MPKWKPCRTRDWAVLPIEIRRHWRNSNQKQVNTSGSSLGLARFCAENFVASRWRRLRCTLSEHPSTTLLADHGLPPTKGEKLQAPRAWRSNGPTARFALLLYLLLLPKHKVAQRAFCSLLRWSELMQGTPLAVRGERDVAPLCPRPKVSHPRCQELSKQNSVVNSV